AKQLGDARVVRYFGQHANGTTRYGLSTGSIASTRLRLPDLSQQRAVSTVVRLVDKSIQAAEVAVNKLRNVRTGLLHDLLSRGLADNGELRDPTRSTQHFTDSTQGKIPSTWQLRPLCEVTTWYSGGTPDRSQTSWWTGAIPFLSPKD